MKSVIEMSITLILFAFICFTGIDFVAMNHSISRVSDAQQLIENRCELIANDSSLVGELKAIQNSSLNGTGITVLFDGENNPKFDGTGDPIVTKVKSTVQATYYTVKLGYNIHSSMFKIGNNYTSTIIVRVPTGN